MLFLTDLEPIDKRYTKQWKTWIPEMFREQGISDILEISADSMEFKRGEFLDINRTNIYKSKQIIKLAELFDHDIIKSGDKFLFYDGWHYGVTALKYMAQLQNIDIDIYSIWHAGSYDPWDFTSTSGLGYWARHNETGWMTANTKMFVATKYHKNLICSGRDVEPSKIIVTGLPFKFDYVDKYDITKKENIVVFPHRISKEKSPEVFDELAKRMSLYGYKFVKTMEVTKNKDEYYELLSRSKVTFSANLQETWGIGTFEALSLGNIPLLPNRLSYTEMYNRAFLYNNIDEIDNRLIDFIDNYQYYLSRIQLNYNYIKENYTENSVKCMVKEMFS